MRPLLAPSLLNVVVDNLRKGNGEGRLFEMSNIYIPKQLPVTELPEERLHLGFAAWGSDEDFFTVKGAVAALGDAFGVELTVERAADVAWLHPGIAAYILCKGERVGVFGKLANDVTAELKLPKDSRSNLNIYLGEIDWVAFHALVPTSLHGTDPGVCPGPARSGPGCSRKHGVRHPHHRDATRLQAADQGGAVRHLPRRKAGR